ncbi:hypothetical protein K402DRAFT_407399 [Aulographum hederae CBS 113979]|uniref:C2 domain-containing protein n=1 Tax=Aulographum hederae CBS 113979 TaxID=1176131 RepID=A0A6G1GPJ1_9PEZI|nr:hypothetical protein K402DRAFT_407399 [Aulographum hederae CBS 113979]
MTVDGPDIGTLVVVVDRAKNLPNRRTMGKQDPYCAARLGKEAKKTETDKRGGQTPRWDQELRFTVHDSADYHNLKVSVFNDDKKTELIGEGWVSLENVVMPGGGHHDLWHTLHCKGKYAGEIRIELTYYDTREPEEKPVVEKKKSTNRVLTEDNLYQPISGPRQLTPVKRRPLPNDPSSASPSPSAIPDHARGVPMPQSAPRSFHTPPATQHSRSVDNTPSHGRHGRHGDSRHGAMERRRPAPYPESPHDAYEDVGQAELESSRDRRSSYNPQYPYPDDPFQRVSSIEPFIDRDGNIVDPSAIYGRAPAQVQPLEPLPQIPSGRGGRQSRQSVSSQRSYDPVPAPYHSGNVPPANLAHSHSAPTVPVSHSLEYSRPERGAHPPFDGHGLEISNGHYQNQDSPQSQMMLARRAPHGQAGDPYHPDHYQSSPSYNDHGYHLEHSMQPTVEDEEDLNHPPPPPPPVHRASAPADVPHVHDRAPSCGEPMAPAPLRINSNRMPMQDPCQQPVQTYQQPEGYYDEPEQMMDDRYEDRRGSNAQYAEHTQQPRRLSNVNAMGSSPAAEDQYALTRVGVQGYSPVTSSSPRQLPPRSQEHRLSISQLQYAASPPAHAQPQQFSTPPRPHPLSTSQSAANQGPPRYRGNSYESPSTYDAAPMIKPRAISPGPSPRTGRMPDRSTPTRKSVSPRPPEPSSTDRRLSAVPFSPDCFDELNPSARLISTQHSNTTSAYGTPKTRDSPFNNPTHNNDEPDVDFHGNKIDPSDRLPVDSWAPEPERKPGEKDRPLRQRDRLTGAREPGAGGGGTITAMIKPLGSGSHSSSDSPSMRNRLQKARPKSAYLTGSDSATGSPNTGGGSPNGYMSSPGTGTYASSSTSLVRSRAGRPALGGEVSRSFGAAPPIPAKIPIAAGEGFEKDDLDALSLEMAGIDLGVVGRDRGTGRGRWGGSGSGARERRNVYD